MKKNSRNTLRRSSWSNPIIAIAIALVLIGALFNGCKGDPPPNQEGAGEVDTPENLRNDPKSSSPITIIPPLLRCGQSVTVRGFVSGAKIRIYVNGTFRDSDTGLDPDRHNVHLSSPLAANDVVTATQEVDGVESAKSPEVNVLDHTELYPSGLPTPGIPFLPLYECGVATYVDNLPPGGNVTVFDQATASGTRSTIGGVNGVEGGQSIGIGPPFIKDHFVSAQGEICSDKSPFSAQQQVQAAPTTIPTPQTTGLYENGQLITVNHLVNGAKVTIKASGSPVGGGGAPADHVRFWLSRPLNSGESVEISQEMCAGSVGTGTETVQPCSALPAPHIAPPFPGDEVIYVINPVPGSRIRVFSGGNEIGDGGGTEVRLTRPLVDGEELIVTQSLGNCTARKAWRVRVGRGLDDPTVPGACGDRFEKFEYGHGDDSDRRTTDVSSYFNSPDFRVTVPMNAVPLHGVGRMPAGNGPFPLVLIVHGNHTPTDASYPGYDYLLDLLASHCMIAVSVEEDFLNGGVDGEMDARGIVLLRHLQLWREWNQTPGHRFFGKVDLNKIGLAGHSRGGEAVVAAHRLNVTDHNPANPLQNFGFNIRALFSIAGVDGQFDSVPITLQGGADYYAMHGSHDGDVFDFGGLRMYNRAYPVNNPTFNTKGFVFVYGANHGQWNSKWETCCEQTLPPLPFPRISSGDQKQIGKAYINAFFLMSLQGNFSYKHFLNGDAGFASLPAAIRVFQYQDPQRTFIDHYQEDSNTATASLTGATNSASATFSNHTNLAFTQNDAPDFLWGDTNGLLLKWQGNSNPEYRVNVAGLLKLLPDYRYVAFHAGQTHEEPSVFNNPASNQDFSVQLVFGGSAGPEVPVSNYAQLRYPATTGPWVFDGMNFNTKKSILRTVRIPFADLRPDAKLRLRDVTEIVFRFNRTASGSIAIDEIQFTQ